MGGPQVLLYGMDHARMATCVSQQRYQVRPGQCEPSQASSVKGAPYPTLICPSAGVEDTTVLRDMGEVGNGCSITLRAVVCRRCLASLWQQWAQQMEQAAWQGGY
eukprot:741333-Alexandrium_andersonii.AAC.1